MFLSITPSSIDFFSKIHTHSPSFPSSSSHTHVLVPTQLFGFPFIKPILPSLKVGTGLDYYFVFYIIPCGRPIISGKITQDNVAQHVFIHSINKCYTGENQICLENVGINKGKQAHLL